MINVVQGVQGVQEVQDNTTGMIVAAGTIVLNYMNYFDSLNSLNYKL